MPHPNDPLSRKRLAPLAHAARLLLLGAPLGAMAQAPAAPSNRPAPVELAPVQVTAPTAVPPLTAVTEDVAASPANVTVLGHRELDRKTIGTYGDIFRGLTGAYVNEYGQGLVAYEIKFRGFPSGHGRDVADFLDGVPLNVTGSQHTNGYADLAQVIPELVNRVEIVRGPFSPFAGNHAVAASVQMFTDRSVPSSIKATVDSFGRARVLPVVSSALGPGTALVALDLTKGPSYTRQSGEERANLFTRYSMPVAGGVASLRLQAYHADADAPGYLDLARIRSGEIDRRDALAQGIGDRKRQQNVVVNFRSDDVNGTTGWDGGWTASLYGVNDRRERFTQYDLALPPDSRVPLGAERDRLRQTGGELRKVASFTIATMPSQLTTGVQLNREHIDALRYTADPDRRPLAPSAGAPDTVGVDRSVRTTTRSAYAQLQLQPVPNLKLTGALRYDHLDFDVDLRPADDTYAPALASGLGTTVRTSAGRFSPKLGAALEVHRSATSTVELYGNYATGLKSPYAFADFFSNVGSTGTLPDLGLSTLRSVEFGAQGAARDDSARWRAGVWDTRQEKEGQLNEAGLFQSFGTTRRRGFDLEGSLALTAATRIYGNYSRVHARSLTAPAGQDRLPNVPEWVAALGLQTAVATGPHRLDLTLEDSLVGPQPITADDTLQGRRYQRLTARVAYSHAAFKGATAFVSLVGYDRVFEETRFDFGGGTVGVSPRPRLQAIAGVQFPFDF